DRYEMSQPNGRKSLGHLPLPRHPINHIQQRSECLLLAHSGHHDGADERPLLGVKRTSSGHAPSISSWLDVDFGAAQNRLSNYRHPFRDHCGQTRGDRQFHQVVQGSDMESKAVQRRLAAILAADVVGYSRLMHTDEVSTLTMLKSHRRELIDPDDCR